MLEITFEYKDAYTHGEWKRQHCTVSSLDQCIKIYGLNYNDVDYRIIEIKEK